MFAEEINVTKSWICEDVISNDEKHQVERVLKFVFFLYAKYFLQAMVPTALWHDLQFWEDT